MAWARLELLNSLRSLVRPDYVTDLATSPSSRFPNCSCLSLNHRVHAGDSGSVPPKQFLCSGIALPARQGSHVWSVKGPSGSAAAAVLGVASAAGKGVIPGAPLSRPPVAVAR